MKATVRTGGWKVNASNPRSVEDALDWQVHRVGSTAWEGWSWKFQRLAYGFLGDDRWPEASEALAWFRENNRLSDGAPPRGALVWYENGVGVTVRCSLGDGRVIGPSLPDAVRISDEPDGDGYLGWTEPMFPYAR